MSFVTGTGCMLGAYISVRLAEGDFPAPGDHSGQLFETVKEAAAAYALAGGRAASKSEGPGSFKPLFFDEIYAITMTGGMNGQESSKAQSDHR